MTPSNGFEWFLTAIKRYAEFQGRSRRREFWYFMLFSVLASGATQALDAGIGTAPLINSLESLAMLSPSIAVSVRRLHDTNRSGWWCLLPIVNLVFWLQDTDPSGNRFGACPKSATETYGRMAAKASVNMSSVEQIERLAALRDKGALTDSEFQLQKSRIL